MATWKKKRYKLEGNYKWKAKPENVIFIADFGALRFDIPRTWVPIPGVTSFKFHDVEPPDDNCALEASVIRTPPGIDWTELPLAPLLDQVLDGKESVVDNVISRTPSVYERRPKLELVSTETRYLDATGRDRLYEACAHTCLARGGGIHALITFAYWLEDRERVTPAWDEVLRTLEVGQEAKGLR